MGLCFDAMIPSQARWSIVGVRHAFPNLKKFEKLTWARRMLTTFGRRRDGPWMDPSKDVADQFSVDFLVM